MTAGMLTHAQEHERPTPYVYPGDEIDYRSITALWSSLIACGERLGLTEADLDLLMFEAMRDLDVQPAETTPREQVNIGVTAATAALSRLLAERA